MEDYVKAAYSQIDGFTIIGLTGRCGSGCSTAGGYLSGDFELDRVSFSSDKSSLCDDIDFNTMKNYAMENELFPFEIIYVRDILTMFIMDEHSSFFRILEKEYPGKSIKQVFYSEFEQVFGAPFDEICARSNAIWGKMENNVYSYMETEMTPEDYNFLFDVTGEVSNFIRLFLKGKLGKDAFTLTYQHLGNLVRKYGTLPDDQTVVKPEPKHIFSIIERINLLVKVLRRKEWIRNTHRKPPMKKSKLHLVIDSIKNVYEAYYMQARYGSFYLMGITVDDQTRKTRVQNKFDDEQLRLIDFREQPNKAKKDLDNDKLRKGSFKEYLQTNVTEYKAFLSAAYNDQTFMFCLQDVDYCIQNADILINNTGTTNELKIALLRYVCLMVRPGLVPPTIDERNMQIAQAAKLNSGCISRQVGAVVCDKYGSILSVGWNDPPAHEGNECFSCIRRNWANLLDKKYDRAYSYYELNDPSFKECLARILYNNLDEETRKKAADLQNPENLHQLHKLYQKGNKSKLQGLPSSFCFKDLYQTITNEKNQVHTRAQHGEEKALEGCNKSQTTEGTLYTTSSSCELCAKKALSYNIARIVYIEPYSGLTNDHVLGHCIEDGQTVTRVDKDGDKVKRQEQLLVELFTGATQRAYSQLYSPLFPLKDELKLRGIVFK